MMRSVYSLRSLNILAAVVVTLVCADVASAQEDGGFAASVGATAERPGMKGSEPRDCMWCLRTGECDTPLF